MGKFGSLIASFASGTVGVVGGALGLFAADRASGGLVKKTIQGGLEDYVEVESGAAWQNKTIDNYVGGRSFWQFFNGLLAGFFRLIGNDELAKKFEDKFKSEQAEVKAGIQDFNKDNVTNYGSGVAGAAVAGTGIALGAGTAVGGVALAKRMLGKGGGNNGGPKGSGSGPMSDLERMQADYENEHQKRVNPDSPEHSTRNPGPESKAETPQAKGRGKFGKLAKLFGYTAATGAAGITVANATAPNEEKAEYADPSSDNSEIVLKSNFDEASLFDEALHKGHVLAHGMQDGIASLAGSPEDLYDMIDGWAGGVLPGDHTQNSTYTFVSEVADNTLISKPEIKSDWDARVHATGQMATWFIPVGGALKAAGVGAKTVNGVKAFEATENTVGAAEIARTGQQLLLN